MMLKHKRASNYSPYLKHGQMPDRIVRMMAEISLAYQTPKREILVKVCIKNYNSHKKNIPLFKLQVGFLIPQIR
jgi:hypothetical protein